MLIIKLVYYKLVYILLKRVSILLLTGKSFKSYGTVADDLSVGLVHANTTVEARALHAIPNDCPGVACWKFYNTRQQFAMTLARIILNLREGNPSTHCVDFSHEFYPLSLFSIFKAEWVMKGRRMSDNMTGSM